MTDTTPVTPVDGTAVDTTPVVEEQSDAEGTPTPAPGPTSPPAPATPKPSPPPRRQS